MIYNLLSRSNALALFRLVTCVKYSRISNICSINRKKQPAGHPPTLSLPMLTQTPLTRTTIRLTLLSIPTVPPLIQSAAVLPALDSLVPPREVRVPETIGLVTRPLISTLLLCGLYAERSCRPTFYGCCGGGNRCLADTYCRRSDANGALTLSSRLYNSRPTVL